MATHAAPLQDAPSSPSNPIVVGLTGGIGAGKSLVARMFAALGAPTWDADETAKKLYQTDHALRQSIVERWGPEVGLCNDQGQVVDVRRSVVADLVFANPEELAWLEAQVHPAVARSFERWLEFQKRACAPKWVVREAAILFESGSDATCDVTITIEAPEPLRIQRVKERARAHGQPVPTEEEIRARMAKQWTESERTTRADHVLRNDEDCALLPQVLNLWRTMCGDLA